MLAGMQGQPREQRRSLRVGRPRDRRPAHLDDQVAQQADPHHVAPAAGLAGPAGPGVVDSSLVFSMTALTM